MASETRVKFLDAMTPQKVASIFSYGADQMVVSYLKGIDHARAKEIINKAGHHVNGALALMDATTVATFLTEIDPQSASSILNNFNEKTIARILADKTDLAMAG